MKFNIEISDTTLLLLAIVAVVWFVMRRELPKLAENFYTMEDQFSVGYPGRLPTTEDVESM